MEQPVYHLEHVVKTKEAMENFDGPLDLILFLLGKNKMEISDIQISLILDQYLAWMEKRRELDLEVASEFVVMSSQLVFIKTRMLLNIHDEEALSEMDELKARLEDRKRHENYRKIRAVSRKLEERYQIGQDYIGKDPEPLEPDKTYRYVHKPEDLLRGLKQAMTRGENAVPPSVRSFAAIVGREPYPVADKVEEISRRLSTFGVARFHTLFYNCRSRSEAVATFLAVLEMCKEGKLSLAGTDSDCTVTYLSDGAKEDPVPALAAGNEQH